MVKVVVVEAPKQENLSLNIKLFVDCLQQI